MKSKKWLISLGLAVVLVVAFAIPACTVEPKEYWHTPIAEGDQKIEFTITATAGEYGDLGLMVVEDLQDLGLDVDLEVIDSTTYYDLLYLPNVEGGMEAFVSAEDPSPDPWSDWIWMMLSDPEDWGYMWNPCWYDSANFTDLFWANYFAPDLPAKKDILYDLQETLAEDVPVFYLTRDDIIVAHRTDEWADWYLQMGGLVNWTNDHSLRECTNLTADDQINIGTLTLMGSLLMSQESLMYTNAGCLYLMIVYDNLAGYPKVGPDEMLADPDAAYGFVPRLATNYTWGDEGTNQTLTIDLRDDVTWHDGEAFTADDVVFTLKYVTNKWGLNKPINWDKAYADMDAEICDDILPEHVLAEKTGEYQVKFTFIEDYHQNEGYFPSVYMWDAPVPEHVFGPGGNGTQDGWMEDPLSWDGNTIGTGPWKVSEFVADSHLLLERNDDYYGPLPAAKQVLFTRYNDTGALFLALEAGNEDAVMGESAAFQKIDDYTADDDLQVDIIEDLSVNYLGFNLHPIVGYAPLQDKVLRQAIAYAIDNQNLVDIVLGGYGEIPHGWTYLESPNYNPGLPPYTYSPTTAESMLTAAGYTKHVE